MTLTTNLAVRCVALFIACTCAVAADNDRPRARDIGLVVGVFPTGEHNAITDVGGVLVV